MMWKIIETIKLTSEWKYTQVINDCNQFRLKNSNVPKAPVGWMTQLELLDNGEFQVFDVQRIYGLVGLRIVTLPKPLFFTNRRLAFKQETKIENNWIIEIQGCCMPSYPIENPPPTNLVASTRKVPKTVTVNPTPTKLLDVNPNRKDVKFASSDKTKIIYLDTDQIVSAASAVDKIDPNSVCVPYIKWTGEWWGISSSGTVTIDIEEYE